MKNLIITTIVALGVSAPAMAQSQLEQSLGVAAGEYTLGELVKLKDASTKTGTDADVFLRNTTINFSASEVHNPGVKAIFDRIAAESDN